MASFDIAGANGDEPLGQRKVSMGVETEVGTHELVTEVRCEAHGRQRLEYMKFRLSAHERWKEGGDGEEGRDDARKGGSSRRGRMRGIGEKGEQIKDQEERMQEMERARRDKRPQKDAGG